MPNQIRIIGGKWRGRKISFPDAILLRPTPNRVRETLFNWLMHSIRGAVCLDMFAGSGSLSFEALSRGARHVVMWEHSKEALCKLKENAQRLQVDHVEIQAVHFPALPNKLPYKFDIVFIDPPFYKGYIKTACQWLVQSHCVGKGSLIYLETEASLNTLPIPSNWEILKSQQAGEVKFYLVTVGE